MLAAFLRRGFGSSPPSAGRLGPGHARVRWLFLKLLALTYLVAFASLFVQVEGLIGSRGILPVTELLDWVQARTGPARFRLLVTRT